MSASLLWDCRGHRDIRLCHYPGSRGGSLGPKHHKAPCWGEVGALQPLPALGWWQGLVVRAVALATVLVWETRSVVRTGLGLNLILATGSKNAGKYDKDGFCFIFQSTFPREEEGGGGGLCSLPALRTFGHQLTLQCWVSPPRESSKLAAGTAAISSSGQHCRGEGLLAPSFAPFTNLPFSRSFLTSRLQHPSSKHLIRWRLH